MNPETPQTTPTAATPATYPGKTLGIVGLVLVFISSIIGLILSIIAYAQSKKAGVKNVPAFVGIIIGGIFTAIGIVVGIYLVSVVLPRTLEVLDLCKAAGTSQVVTKEGVVYTCTGNNSARYNY